MAGDWVILTCVLLIVAAILSPVVWANSEYRIHVWRIVGLFAIAAAILFHAWWPSYKVERDLETYVAECIEESQSNRKACIKEYYYIYSDRLR